MLIRRQAKSGVRENGIGRPGLSLIEVLVALSIFLISMIALGQLITISGERAFEVQQQSRAAQLCQSKLAEVVSGVVPLSSDSGQYDEDTDWQWTVDAEQDSSITGLWRVQVTASRDFSDGSHYESSVNQMILDPSLRGSTADTLQSPVVGNNPSTGSGTGATGTGAGSGGQGAMAGGIGAGASGMGAMAPKSSTPNTTAPKSNTPTASPPRTSTPTPTKSTTRPGG
jgi:prepilin-type N-terminal cleavage/methylation domain-containing protein